ncbi:MAG: hypothetical protein IPJ09_01290 [Saprospiraceae bacterium]|nr:hypothetical protein [Saprospiraceae bacterium]
MKNIPFSLSGLLLICVISHFACKETSKPQDSSPMTEVVSESLDAGFDISVRTMEPNPSIPGLQSAAWARSGNKVLLIGGRKTGFHGLSGLDTIFNSRLANKSIYVLDMSTWTSTELKLNPKDQSMLQFFSSNMEFFQDKDTLYIVGGYGTTKITGSRSDFTFDKMLAINVPLMISQVESQGDPQKAILYTIQSPFVQVSGGELIKQAGTFYLMFGQNYIGAYTLNKTGNYTEAIRVFKVIGGKLADTASIRNSELHRRDLNVVVIPQKSGSFFATFGGVFTAAGNGFDQPIYITPAGLSTSYRIDTLHQLTSQYNCARVVIYDQATDKTTVALMGGIGRFQYHVDSAYWEDGDDGALLPFVKTITQMQYVQGNMAQRVQIPPGSPELPALLGANAIFLANPDFSFSDGTIDYAKIKGNLTTIIGYLYGGIQSPSPSSNDVNPSSVNNQMYEVILTKK